MSTSDSPELQAGERGRIPLFEEELDYIDEEHIDAFAKALVWEEQDEQEEWNSRTTQTSKGLMKEVNNHEETSDVKKDANAMRAAEIGAGLGPVKRPDLITSKSDWYPLTNSHRKYKRRTRKASKSSTKKIPNEFRSSSAYSILRWPVLMFIIGWVLFLCFLYVSVRIYVALTEYFFTWVGERKVLRDRLRQATTYEEWIKGALELDKFLNLDSWSTNPKFSYYDYKTVALTISRLRRLRQENDDKDLMVFLQGCLKKNFAGIENRQLYSHRYYGTKKLVEEYVEEVAQCIDKISNSTSVSFEAKRKFFRIVLKNYGKTALCLSGGACFAYTHFGLVKALQDNNLLPSIVSGTSGGGLVAALTCTRTDEELKKLLVPQLARKITACEDPWYIWIPRFIKTGARFDAVTWARKSSFFTRGSTTFEEAYKRTGRKLNISTVPGDPHSPVILCNNITSPHCIIWSSLLASSAVPGILNPVVLMMKNPNNKQVIPFSLGSKWRDGSLRTDIPVEALNTYYNVNFSIVSQVNPHISLFFFAPKGTVGRPVAMAKRKTHKEKFASLRGGFIATALEQLFKLEITKWLQIVKTLDLLPHFMEQDWLNIWLQRFSGSITIWPRIRLKDFWYILSDPDEEKLQELILKGERSMFPRLLFVKHRLTIERAIERGRKSTKLSTKINTVVSESSEATNDFQINNVEYEEDDDFESDLSEYDSKTLMQSLGTQMFPVGSEDEEDEEQDEDYLPSTGDDDITSSSEESENIDDDDTGEGSIFSLLLRSPGNHGSKDRRNTIT
ncbi:patatin-like phospholipase domain-containing protein [Suhomyces tanzawaensis NRRL Y-17324]|uniref:Patatin-like phospholipase domain-containing protein n=1 Tax=Suhomyces tanzawaensis NRRL Y-17324 TaxID=984487 RepID=A0A1E4SCR8_9ASCO|nr:patatin-like phospholipase domain-containing protein [Suhomyces tanzawaensis NRRL Y-17324]ODV77299.1 patatin-like phospholipase domain-containing protein [Suhomyces tanzawaensis NRRL Y-17324]